MNKTPDEFYESQEQQIRDCLLALKTIILTTDNKIVSSLKYGMPFFSYDEKMLCYLWVHKKYKKPYVGFVDGNKIQHPQLLKEKRARMKILLVDPEKDIPVRTIRSIVKESIRLCKRR